jgi:hypothetical protein
MFMSSSKQLIEFHYCTIQQKGDWITMHSFGKGDHKVKRDILKMLISSCDYMMMMMMDDDDHHHHS